MTSPADATGASSLPTHLIIVCCHAIYLGSSGGLPGSGAGSESDVVTRARASRDEKNWLIEPFQQGETDTYIAHVEAGVRALAQDPNALLVFSGGATKRDRTDKTEGDGYFDVAVEHDFFNVDTTATTTGIDTATADATQSSLRLRDRIFVDRYATDSYQNILSSLVQWPIFVEGFKSKTSSSSSSTEKSKSALPGGGGETRPNDIGAVSWPSKLTIVSHDFKRSRFLDLHLPAIQWPSSSVEYVGIDPPFDEVRMLEIQEGDRVRGYGAWRDDLYASGHLLSSKRVKRGWDPDVFRRDVLDRFSHGTTSPPPPPSSSDNNDDGDTRSALEKVVFWNQTTTGRVLTGEDVPWS
ncbi:hypothetical protein PV08_10204 [Exophiala spinifera]|uniref:DUF218 domain-containing protein n=1 Tax=Exophiala spinifera TaxID=91928 RepID=A0A0D2AWS8_9EURO|nr:uncharacterized protein PV08_10204 [Exophiala spinifera]KIW10905.1 hypothetical protein PV08_10204 [Exophiala spinifera]